MTNSFPPCARTEPLNQIWAAQHLLVAQTLRTFGGRADLVLLGDSITQGWQWDRSWARLEPGRKILNFGLGGDRIEHLLFRLEQGLIDGLAIPHACLLIGTNNLQPDSKPEQLAAGISTCLERIRRGLPDAGIVLYGIFPVRERFPAAAAVIRETNKQLRAVAAAHRADFRDIGNQLVDETGEVPFALMPDGTHLTGLAYDLWTTDLLAWLGDRGTTTS